MLRAIACAPRTRTAACSVRNLSVAHPGRNNDQGRNALNDEDAQQDHQRRRQTAAFALAQPAVWRGLWLTLAGNSNDDAMRGHR